MRQCHYYEIDPNLNRLPNESWVSQVIKSVDMGATTELMTLCYGPFLLFFSFRYFICLSFFSFHYFFDFMFLCQISLNLSANFQNFKLFFVQ